MPQSCGTGGSVLDHAQCEQARLSRDPRFDGRFFIGVTTTGIYCRTTCPVHPPKPRNVRFFPTAAAAEEAGFRPCLRCRPESAPGSPAWAGTSATVQRALRCIEEGALDEGSVASLAGSLGITSRHLGRLFHEHLGASPVTLAQTRRLHLAKKLLDETALPIAQVALASGFSSVRRFNDAMQKRYARTPMELRSMRNEKQSRESGGPPVLTLHYREPYDWDAMFRFLEGRAVAGVEHVEGRRYARTITVGNAAGAFEIEPQPGEGRLCLRIWLDDFSLIPVVVERVRRIFDLGADTEVIAGHLRADRLLAPVVARHPGLRVPGAWDGFELALRAVLGQQISVQGATTRAAKIAARYGEPFSHESLPMLTRYMPRATAIAGARREGLGVPVARACTLRALAKSMDAGELTLDGSAESEAVRQTLLAIPGIGEWTADYIALRALRDPDAFPAGDLGLRLALSTGGKPLPEKLVRERAERWRPWRAYAALYLWQRYAEQRS